MSENFCNLFEISGSEITFVGKGTIGRSTLSVIDSLPVWLLGLVLKLGLTLGW